MGATPELPQVFNADGSYNKATLREYNITEEIAGMTMRYSSEDGSQSYEMTVAELLQMESKACPMGGWLRRSARQGLDALGRDVSFYKSQGVETKLDTAIAQEQARRGEKRTWGQQ